MKKTPPNSDKLIENLRKVALSCPNTEETLSCKGTAIESATFKIKSKSFIFVRPGNVMVKLDTSLEEAGKLAKENPKSLKVGKGGWTTITAPGSKEVPLSLLKKWTKESYELFCAPKNKKK